MSQLRGTNSGATDVQHAGTVLTTVQETSKRLKVQIIISAILFWGGLIGMFVLVGDGSGQPPTFTPMLSSLAVMGGFVWYIVTKVRIWWHHK